MKALIEQVVTQAVEQLKVDLGKVSVDGVVEHMELELSDIIRNMRDSIVDEEHEECAECGDKDDSEMMTYTSAGFICTTCEEEREENRIESVRQNDQYFRDVI